ncbi:MAG: hypothetical protein L6422_02945 [Candidatus Marinimicrobia bacterium]|nr:hypothetical protein [Nanoarchaeota archaeon]MCG2715236.1 hypothetical protein [Candidatus Neomarinimicrobiota bacterium]
MSDKKNNLKSILQDIFRKLYQDDPKIKLLEEIYSGEFDEDVYYRFRDLNNNAGVLEEFPLNEIPQESCNFVRIELNKLYYQELLLKIKRLSKVQNKPNQIAKLTEFKEIFEEWFINNSNYIPEEPDQTGEADEDVELETEKVRVFESKEQIETHDRGSKTKKVLSLVNEAQKDTKTSPLEYKEMFKKIDKNPSTYLKRVKDDILRQTDEEFTVNGMAFYKNPEFSDRGKKINK